MPRPDAQIRVITSAQKLEVWQGGNCIESFACSTSQFGLGSEPESFRTPRGRLQVVEKIGDGAPQGTIFRSRISENQCWTADALNLFGLDEDLVLSRILWLGGLEPHNANTKSRYIYIHGTNSEHKLGEPSSHGCIRLSNSDVIKLFDMVSVGTTVECI